MLLYLSIFNSISIPVTKIRENFDHPKDRKNVSVCLSSAATRLLHVTCRTRIGWQRGGDELMSHESTILIARSCHDSAACGDKGHVERKWPANNARHTDMRSATPQGRVTKRVDITRADNTALYWVIAQRVVVISYWRLGTTYRYHLQLVGWPESSVRNYYYSLRFTP